MARHGLSGIFVWRRVCDLGYLPLESFLSVEPILDEAIICVDPEDGDKEEHRLAQSLSDKFDKVRLVVFAWPSAVPSGSSPIGVASQFALQQATGSHVISVQPDEIWNETLLGVVRDNLWKSVDGGYECFRFKVLHTEFNGQFFKGGGMWDGDYRSEAWRWQAGAGYNTSIKIAKRCPAIKFSQTAWTFVNCGTVAHVKASDTYPILRLHQKNPRGSPRL